MLNQEIKYVETANRVVRSSQPLLLGSAPVTSAVCLLPSVEEDGGFFLWINLTVLEGEEEIIDVDLFPKENVSLHLLCCWIL